MSDQQKTNTAAVMIENALRLAMLAGHELLAGKTEDGLHTCGICLAQLYAFEAMRQKTGGLPLVGEWQSLWARATRQQHSLYQQAMQRSNN